jgi:hypothetical protein
MKLKPGVRIHGISPEIVIGLLAAQRIYDKYGAELVVTSALDGKHSKGSLHYTGEAVDLRSRTLKAPSLVASEIRDALGPDFDVVVESDHIHMEYQPKKQV